MKVKVRRTKSLTAAQQEEQSVAAQKNEYAQQRRRVRRFQHFMDIVLPAYGLSCLVLGALWAHADSTSWTRIDRRYVVANWKQYIPVAGGVALMVVAMIALLIAQELRVHQYHDSHASRFVMGLALALAATGAGAMAYSYMHVAAAGHRSVIAILVVALHLIVAAARLSVVRLHLPQRHQQRAQRRAEARSLRKRKSKRNADEPEEEESAPVRGMFASADS